MIKQLKTLVLAIGLVAGVGLARTSFAAKPKEAAPAAAAPPRPTCRPWRAAWSRRSSPPATSHPCADCCAA